MACSCGTCDTGGSRLTYVFPSLPPLYFVCQVALFSATMPSEALDLTSKFMRDPAIILVKREELTLDGIKQVCV